MNSLELTLAPEGKREGLGGTKGKRENVRKTRGPPFPPYNQTARTHARTKRSRFPGWAAALLPPTSDDFYDGLNEIIPQTVLAALRVFTFLAIISLAFWDFPLPHGSTSSPR